MDILTASSVHKSYGSLSVLEDVSLSVAEGSVFAIIGPNGAGKTTLFKVMTGESLANSGRIMFAGEDVTRQPAHERVCKGMGRTFQVARVFNDFTVLGNVIAAIESRRRLRNEGLGMFYAIKPSAEVTDEADELIADGGLTSLRDAEARNLSHGDRKRLEFLITLALKPKVLMLDEPTAGMSPADRIGIAELISRIRTERGITVVMTEHDMDIVFSLADRVMVLSYGEVVATGSVEQIRSNPAVQEVYLGKEMIHA